MRGRALKAGALWIAAAGYLAAGSAAAATVEASSTTLLAGRPEVRYGEVHSALPIVELVGLNAHGFDVPVVDDLKIRVAGWGRLDPLESAGQLAGDFEVAFVQGRLLDRRLALTLGRHMVTGGAARFLHLDGGSADVRIAKGVGITAYGGLPVIPRMAAAKGDALYGGRLYWRGTVGTEVGASYIQVYDHGRTARQDAGLDARVPITRSVALSAYGLWSVYEQRLAEVNVGPNLFLGEDLTVRLEYRRTAPDLFLARSSIFSVFAETERDEAGGDFGYQLNRWTALFVEYHSFWTNDGRGDDGMARLTFRSDPSTRTLLGAQARVFRAPVNGYVEGRLFGTYRPMDKLSVALDLDLYQFLEDVNGTRTSFTSALTGSYNFAPGWLAVLSGAAGTSVLMHSRFEVIAKLVYNIPTTTSGRTP